MLTRIDKKRFYTVFFLGAMLLLLIGLFVFLLSSRDSYGSDEIRKGNAVNELESDDAGKEARADDASEEFRTDGVIGDDTESGNEYANTAVSGGPGSNDTGRSAVNDSIKSDPAGDDGGGTEKCLRLVRVGGEYCFVRFYENAVELYIDDTDDIFCYNAGETGNSLISVCISDIDHDETDEILVITGEGEQEYGSYFRILEPEMKNGSVSLREVSGNDMTYLNPWKIQTCDVDGDGQLEISAGVYKTARFHPVMAKRPFIYDLHEDGISPKWLGSRLSRPFDDYIFADINNDGADEIISTEYLEDGKKVVNSYAWKGFGFESIGESRAYDDILKIRSDGDICEIVESAGTWNAGEDDKAGVTGEIGESRKTGETGDTREARETGETDEGKQLIDVLIMADGQERWIKLIFHGGVLSEVDQ